LGSAVLSGDGTSYVTVTFAGATNNFCPQRDVHSDACNVPEAEYWDHATTALTACTGSIKLDKSTDGNPMVTAQCGSGHSAWSPFDNKCYLDEFQAFAKITVYGDWKTANDLFSTLTETSMLSEMSTKQTEFEAAVKQVLHTDRFGTVFADILKDTSNASEGLVQLTKNWTAIHSAIEDARRLDNSEGSVLV
jgi:hypothetical protein